MTDIVFDSSTLISIATNNLLWVLPHLKKHLQGNFYITEAVKKEIINVPLHSKRFKLEAIQVISLISSEVIQVYPRQDYVQTSRSAFDNANNIYHCRGNPLQLIQEGELQSLVLAKQLNAVLAVDERTMRLLIENPDELRKLMEHKLHSTIITKLENLKTFSNDFGNVPVIRSTELMVRAYELGILDSYLNMEHNPIRVNLTEELLDGLLWGLRLRGCSISTREIEQVKKLTKKER